MKNITHKKKGRKSMLRPSTIQLVKDFFQLDKLLGVQRFSFLKEQLGTEMIGVLFENAFLPIINKKVKSLNFGSEPFSMRAFRRICKSRGIRVLKSSQFKFPENVKGYFVCDKSGNKWIWIKNGLTRKQRLYVAAHELSHYCLHSKNMINGKYIAAFRSPLIGEEVGEKFAEMEADLMATVLLRKEVRNESRR